MNPMGRRQFLRASAFGAGALAVLTRAKNQLVGGPLGLPIGLELYTVRHESEKDLPGTLKKVAEVGYKEVELYTFYGKKAAELHRTLRNAGLPAISAHYDLALLRKGWERQVEYAHDLALEGMICAWLEPHERQSLDDYRYAADLFNKCGEECHKAGIQFAYHNHDFEFKSYDGILAFDELLRRTDPELVKLELDCFWMTRAGKDPLAYFARYPGRFPLLHIKDLKPGFPVSTEVDEKPEPFTEVGRGSIDWARIFKAAPQGGVKHYFVEQDYCERSPFESIKISFDYLQNLKV